MKKQVWTLAEIGVVYVVVSMILESLLSGYKTLLLPVLSFTFIFFATIMFGTLWEPRAAELTSKTQKPHGKYDDFTQLEHLCNLAIEQGDVDAAKIVSDRVQALAFKAASYRLNMSATSLRSMSKEQSDVFARCINDPQMLSILSAKHFFIRKGDALMLKEYLTTIKAWAR
jgi:hypothetical protein